MRLLVIDHDPAFVLVLRQMLDGLGLPDPDCTATAREALRLLGAGARFDCIILDLDLPGGAAALCRRLRLLPEHGATPILLIARPPKDGDLAEALAAGASDYVSRQIDPLELRARLGMAARLTDERRRSRALALRLHGLAAAGFGDPQPVLGLEGVMELAAFEDRLRHGHTGQTALAFRIGNAGAIAAAATAAQYHDMLTHVAAVILDRLRPEGLVLAHAGQGEFMGLMPAPPTERPHVLAEVLGLRLADRAPIYDRLALPRPVLQVGKPMRPGLFFRSTPERLIRRARETLRRPDPAPQVLV
ncbi:response regulator [Cereibacter azotoformans]|uniref:response regulator n=1 Tax=Cereibacter azotoformans TaxID=43057 RepID=UPI000C6D5B55|nr:response regulator [Cereibacter azotoformans]